MKRGRRVNAGFGPQRKIWIRLLFYFATSALLTFILVLAGPLAGAKETSLAKVTFIPQWIPQAQFAGYYVVSWRILLKQS